MLDTNEVNAEIKRNSMKPVFTDGVIVGLRLKTKAKKNTDLSKPVEPKNMNIAGGMIEVVFTDVSKQMPLGIFILDRQTAEELKIALNQTTEKLDELLKSNDLSKLMPKQDNRHADNSYR